MEGEEGAPVVGHPQMRKSDALAKPVGAKDKETLRLPPPDRGVGGMGDAVPVFMILGDRFIEEFEGDLIVWMVGEGVRQIFPQSGEPPFFGRIAVEGGVFVEKVVRAQDVEVDNHPQTRFPGPCQTILKQSEGFRVAAAVFLPELFLIDGEPQMVKAPSGDPLDILADKVLPAPRTPRLRLAQPVRNIDAPVYRKARIHSIRIKTSRAVDWQR